MKYNLHEFLYAFNCYSNVLFEGKVRSIRTTKYEPNDRFKEGSLYIEYMIADNWFNECNCYDNKLEALKCLKSSVEIQIERLVDNLRRVEDKIERA